MVSRRHEVLTVKISAKVRTRLEIDKSASNGVLRAVAPGSKNYRSAGSDADGERAAVFYPPIGLAELNGLEPELRQRIRERALALCSLYA